MKLKFLFIKRKKGRKKNVIQMPTVLNNSAMHMLYICI